MQVRSAGEQVDGILAEIDAVLAEIDPNETMRDSYRARVEKEEGR
jgi:hypothetical protein